VSSEAAVHTSGLGCRFGDLEAVRELDLSIGKGEIFGLVGPDGAGKTTTMRMLTAILPPTSGEAWVGGYEVQREPEAIKERIGYMSQRFGLYGDLTVAENIRFYADLYRVPRAEYAEREERLLGFSNLTPFHKRLARNLSGGMKQKLGLACALIHQPEILFLDEPTNGVDPVSRRDFWHILYQMLREGVTIIVSTAYLDEAERCSRVGFLAGGRMVRCDTPRNLKRALPGLLYEIETDDVRGARERLTGALGQRRVGLFGGRLHLFAEDADDAERALQMLREAGQTILRAEPITPGLEDIFIHASSEEEAT